MFAFKNIFTGCSKLSRCQSPGRFIGATYRNIATETSESVKYDKGHGNVGTIEFPCTTPILFYDRLFEEPTSKNQIYNTANYDVAKNGVDDQGRLAVYCSELFRPLISNNYDELKNYPFDWLVEHGFEDAGGRSIRGHCSARSDIAGQLLVWGGCKELEKIILQFVGFVFIVDDLLETETSPNPEWIGIRASAVDMMIRMFNNLTVSEHKIKKLSEKFKTITSSLEAEGLNLADADTTYFGDNRRVEVILRCSLEIASNCRKIMTTAQMNLFFAIVRNWLRKSLLQLDHSNSIEKGVIPTSEMYFNTRKDSIGLMPFVAISSIINCGNQDELLKSHNDGLTDWVCYLMGMINDVHSYPKEKRMNTHFFNLVNIYCLRDPALSEFDAMAQVVKLYNSQQRAVEKIIQNMDSENRVYYVRCMKILAGIVEYSTLCTRYGWRNVSGIHENHDKLIYDGQVY